MDFNSSKHNDQDGNQMDEDPPKRLKFMEDVFQPLKATKWVTEEQYISKQKNKKGGKSKDDDRKGRQVTDNESDF